MGRSLLEADMCDTARMISVKASEKGCKIHLPVDGVAAEYFVEGAKSRVTPYNSLKDSEMVLDIGPASVERAFKVLAHCKTALWNGPMGAFEMVPFDNATIQLARHAAELTRKGALITVAGGGDTVAALNHAGVADQFSYLSVAGGAFLEWIEGKQMPGIAVLTVTP